MRTRLLPVLGLSAALLAAGCTHPDGSTDWGSTLAVGAGVAAVAGLVALAASDNNSARSRYRGHDRRPSYHGLSYHGYDGRQVSYLRPRSW